MLVEKTLVRAVMGYGKGLLMFCSPFNSDMLPAPQIAWRFGVVDSWNPSVGLREHLQIPCKKCLPVGDLFFGPGYGSIPINTIFSGMNIHLPAILMFTRGTRF
jgi:hypothetical protein